MKRFIILCVLAAGTFITFPLPAGAEKIDDYFVSISIQSDASIKVRENIQYDFESVQKHGIFRTIPVRYKARGGNYNLRVSDIFVADENGRAYPLTASRSGNDLEIKIGDKDKLITGTHTYVISYTVQRAINFFDTHDELYWNAIGTSWAVPIGNASVEIKLPQPISAEQLQSACYLGSYESNVPCSEETNKSAALSGEIIQQLPFDSYQLRPGEGMTVVIGVPKGIINQPSFLSRFWETALDNWVIAVPVLTFLFLLRLWYVRGRDPKGRGTIIAQFDPPDGLTPAEVGTVLDERASNKDISAEIVYLAERGYIKITRTEKGKIFKSDDYILKRLKEGDNMADAHDNKLLDSLFKKAKENNEVKLSELRNSFYRDIENIRKKFYEAAVDKKYFLKSPRKTREGYIILGIAIAVLGWFAGVAFGFWGAASAVISGALVALFGIFMPAKTRKGVLAEEHILGLKQYLSVAEKDRIAFHNAPEKNPDNFEKLLPYAMVLGVEKEWAKQFEGIYNQQPAWYSDASGRSFSSLVLVSSLGSFQSSANTTLTSRPSSASGGGSGFSGGGVGGGFGGGGGGSW